MVHDRGCVDSAGVLRRVVVQDQETVMYQLITSNPAAAAVFAVLLGAFLSSCVIGAAVAWGRVLDWWAGDE